MRLSGKSEQRLIGVGPHSILDHVGDRVRRDGRQSHKCGVGALQHRQGFLHRRPARPGAGGQHPQHRHIRARGGQRPQRRQRAVIGPVNVLQHNRQRSFRGRRMNRIGQIVHTQ